MPNRYIFITDKFEGYHKYVDAPEEVAFLRNVHRHLFGVRVKISIFHNDRDIEFILFKHEIQKFIDQYKADNQNMSCEAIAESVYNYLHEKYPNRLCEVEINEDGENGAILGDF